MTNKTIDTLLDKVKDISLLDVYAVTCAALAGTTRMQTESPKILNSVLIGLPIVSQTLVGVVEGIRNLEKDLTGSEEYKNFSKHQKSEAYSRAILSGLVKGGAIGCAEALAGYYLVAPLLEKIL